MALEDDEWALRRLREVSITPDQRSSIIGEGSYRYLDQSGVVHRAWWSARGWESLCGVRNPIKRLVEDDDPGAVTCLPCTAGGA